MTLLQAYGISRYYEFNGNGIKNIIFYNDNGIIVETKQGWLEHYGDIRAIECGEIVNRNKVNLTRKENFVIKTSSKDWKNRAKLALYLYVDNCNISIQKTAEDVKKYGNSYDLSYGYNYFNTFEGVVNGQKFKMTISTKYENIDIKEKKEAKKLYESLKDDLYFIDESDFYKLFNLCKISIRNEKLIKN